MSITCGKNSIANYCGTDKTKKMKADLKTEKLTISKAVLLENYCKRVDEKINALKLEYMKEWESNHNFDSTDIDSKLQQLEDEKDKLCAAFNELSTDEIALDLQDLLKAS